MPLVYNKGHFLWIFSQLASDKKIKYEKEFAFTLHLLYFHTVDGTKQPFQMHYPGSTDAATRIGNSSSGSPATPTPTDSCAPGSGSRHRIN